MNHTGSFGFGPAIVVFARAIELGEVRIGCLYDLADADGGRLCDAGMVESVEVAKPHLHHVVARLKAADAGPRRRAIGAKLLQ